MKFTPLDITDEESISDVLLTIDMSIQYGENADVKDRYPEVKHKCLCSMYTVLFISQFTITYWSYAS